MELCFVQLRLFLIPRSFLIDIYRWNYEHSKHTQTRRHNFYTTRSTECSKEQTLSIRKRLTWFRPQRLRFFWSRSELLQACRMQPQQVQPSKGQPITRFSLESESKTGQSDSGCTYRNRSRMVQSRWNHPSSSGHSENSSSTANFDQGRNRQCHSEWQADPHAKQRLVKSNTATEANPLTFNADTSTTSLTYEDPSADEQHQNSEAKSDVTSLERTIKCSEQSDVDRLHSVERDTTQGVKMLDEDLVQLLQNGQREAFTTLVSKWQDRIFTFCYRQLRETSLAEEATQDVFVKVYTSIHNFRKESKFSTWLYRIATNHCINLNNRHHRRHRNQHQSFDEMHTQPAEEHTPLQQLERRDFEQQLQQALHQLPEEHRVLLILRDIQDCSYEEISEITQLNIGTIKSRIHRGRHNLRQILNGGQES